MPKMEYEVDANGCHIWQRATNNRGYGVVWYDGKVHLAHRVAWRLAHGRWHSPNRVIDHVCNVKACVNAAHLREIENWQNLRRAHPPAPTPEAERRRAANRRAHQRARGTYSPTYTAERGDPHTLV